MKRLLAFSLFAILLVSCSKATPGPTPGSDEVILAARSFAKPIETHEKAYEAVCKDLANNILGYSKKYPSSEFVKDSVRIFNEFVDGIQKIVDKYSGGYIYGVVTVGKSHRFVYPHYDAVDLKISSAKNAYVLVPIIKGREKNFLQNGVQYITDVLDSRVYPTVTSDDINVIEPRILEMIENYKNILACGSIELRKVSYKGEDVNVDVIKTWNLPEPKALYELYTIKADYHSCYSAAYKNAVSGIEFDTPIAFKSESEAVEIADEVFNYLNGRFFHQYIDLHLSNDCFENYKKLKYIGVEMAEKVWGAEPMTIARSSYANRVVVNAIAELEPTGVCYEKDYRSFKEKIREACINKSVADDTLRIFDCNAYVRERELQVVDTLILR